MRVFDVLEGSVVPMDRANVDTDQIIPKQFLKAIGRTGFGDNLFDGWRYLDEGQPGQTPNERQINPEFVLNQARYQGASILLARENFGCGSSREHAVWALEEYGIRCVIAPSFADIFFNNCFKSSVLPIVLPVETVDALFEAAQGEVALQARVDLEAQILSVGEQQIPFEVDSFRRHCLLNGLDDIGLTLQMSDDIRAYEERRRQQAPWLFDDLNQPAAGN